MSHEIQYAKALLDRWGAYMERHMADQHGLPRIEIIYASRIGKGGGGPGHQILCMDPPRSIWVTGYLVSRLPPAEKEAIEAWHVFRLKPDNREWAQQEKAEILRINYGTFRARVSRGTRRIAAKLFGELA